MYNERKDLEIERVFQDAVLEMLDSDIFDVYCAFSIIFLHLKYEIRGIAPFCIDRKRILNKLRQSLVANERGLREYKKWTGSKFDEGMWGEVIRINRIWTDDWGVSFL